VRGWTSLYRLSWRLGLRHLLRRGFLREAVIRLVVPLEPSRYLELPQTIAALGAGPGERVVDLASPKLAAAALATDGAEVVSIDAFPVEVETWRRLAGHIPGLTFEVGDARSLPQPDASFDHGYSISVIEHIEAPGDVEALRELARVVKPGGRVVVTVPYADRHHEVWRDQPLYADSEGDGPFFFERWYDRPAVDRLVESVPELRLTELTVARLRPNLHRAYVRLFPLLVPLGPLFGLLVRERSGPPGDVARLSFVRERAA
jgi:SAM-dependent methyltransferase